MTPWIKIALITNLVYWAVFVSLAIRRRPGAGAIVLGVMHMLLAGVVSVAPIRSFVDADYPGFRIGVLHFEHRGATLPATIILVWALSSAFLLASRARGGKLWVVVGFDVLFALNQLADILRSGTGGNIQFGEHLTIGGLQAALIMAALFVGGPALSAWWTGRRALRPTTS
jgi:hypothetical protein